MMLTQVPFLSSESLATSTVLLVHNRSPLNRELSTELRFSGYRLFEAASASDAQRIAEREAPKQDIGLLVIDADVMGDVETLARQIHDLYPEVRTLFLGMRSVPDGTTGISACLARPFTRRDFSKAVRGLMHNKVPALR
jgi:DNA-binding response OmpR family regulator